MTTRLFLSFLVFTVICLPCIIVSIPVVAYLLHTPWDGLTTIFGNAKWGRGTAHPTYKAVGFWQEFIWLVWRNPVNNLMAIYLGVAHKPSYWLEGKPDIGDKIAAGFYQARMGWAWEYYWIKPYTVFGSKRCVRVRIGWKIYNNPGRASYVFAINPWKVYLGA